MTSIEFDPEFENRFNEFLIRHRDYIFFGFLCLGVLMAGDISLELFDNRMLLSVPMSIIAFIGYVLLRRESHVK